MMTANVKDECERLRRLGASVGAFTASKHEAYGGAYTGGAALLRELAPEGVNPELYVAAILATRILEKLERFFVAPKAFDESPLVDVVGHALCLAMLYGAEPPAAQTTTGAPPDIDEAARLLRDAISLVADHVTGEGVDDLSEHRHLGRKLMAVLVALDRPDDSPEPLFDEAAAEAPKAKTPPGGVPEVDRRPARLASDALALLEPGHPAAGHLRAALRALRTEPVEAPPSPEPCGVTRGMGAERCAAPRLHKGKHDYRPTCEARSGEEGDDERDKCLEWPGHKGDHAGMRDVWPNEQAKPDGIDVYQAQLTDARMLRSEAQAADRDAWRPGEAPTEAPVRLGASGGTVQASADAESMAMSPLARRAEREG